MALFESKVAKHGFVAAWILGGIARQIGFDARSGALNAKNLFRSWMKQKWQRVPRPVRKVAFGIGVSARAAYRGARHSDRTLRRGVQQGIVEGQHRHREWQELREMQREFPGNRDHPHYAETLERIQADRLNRFFEHQRHAAEVRQAVRERDAEPARAAPAVSTPLGDLWRFTYTSNDGELRVFDNLSHDHAQRLRRWRKFHIDSLGTKEDPGTTAPMPQPVPPLVRDAPVQSTVPDPVVAPTPKTNGQAPIHPGEPTTPGNYQTVYTAADGTKQVFAGRTEEHAKNEAAWWEWRKDKPGGLGGSVTTEPMPDSALPATNGHVVSSGCPDCAHNH